MQSILVPTAIGGGIALVLGLILVAAARIFALPVDEKLETIRAALPGVNCGACGYSGCDAYAMALRDGEPNAAKCPVGGKDTAIELAAILGMNPPSFIPKVAYVHCQGTTDHTKKRYDYQGIISCASAQGLFSGPNSCTFGCMGFGDCVAVCPYDAITVTDGIAHINSERCKACGLCVAACPKELIKIIPRHYNAYTVSCRNKWPGAQTRKNCKVGCIGCSRCYKACPSGAITMDGPLAVIDQNLCTHCNKCLEVCPTHAIQRGLFLGDGPDGKPERSRKPEDPVAPTPALGGTGAS
ncbi:MAG: RnfABCDGE type electron transport complex subunit B [Clostridiaceae bacterium]|nr:RnfABCDGE type electron transport complex subunit B [Clostridiaceae bacterium]